MQARLYRQRRTAGLNARAARTLVLSGDTPQIINDVMGEQV
jgi:hypothetical protein